MVKSILIFGLAIASGASLCACHREAGQGDAFAGSGNGEESGRMEDQFGNGFGEKFRASPNSEPAKVRSDDVKPVSLTAEPLPVS